MSFYASASFFLALVVLGVPASVLGLAEKSLRRYGMVASCIMLALLFSQSPAQLVAFVAFLVVALVALRLTLASWRSGKKNLALYRACLAATLAPLVIYKVSFAAGEGLWGFIGLSYVTFKAVQVLIEVRDGLIDQIGTCDYLYFLTFFATVTCLNAA